MKRQTAWSTPYYEIVKYNLRTRKDLEVLPDRFQVLSEVNHEIEALNTRLKASKKDGAEILSITGARYEPDDLLVDRVGGE